MKKTTACLIPLILLSSGCLNAKPSGKQDRIDRILEEAGYTDTASEVLEFEHAKLIYESNITDGDAEVVAKIKSDEEMRDFSIFDPSGKKIVQIKSRDKEKLGLAQFVVESGEPSPEKVQAAFPEGNYIFIALTTEKNLVVGEAMLTHDLLDPPKFSPDDEEVPVVGATVSWDADEEADGYMIEIEQEDMGLEFAVELDSGFTKFTIPPEFLESGYEYDIGVGVFNSDGNLAVAESSFEVE